MAGSEACLERAAARPATQGSGGEASKDERMGMLGAEAVAAPAERRGIGAAGGGRAIREAIVSPGRALERAVRSGRITERTSAERLEPSHEELLRVRLTRRRMLLFATFVLAALAFLYLVLPQLGGVKQTWDRLNDGDAWWIAVAVVVELVSMAGYIAIFQGVHVPPGSPIRFRHSYQITMAGLAATRLFAAGGAGGVAVTAWSLRHSGMRSREVAQRMIAFLVLLYGVYLAALVVFGVGLYTGLFPGPHPFAITVVPAIVGAVGLAAIVALALVPADLDQRLQGAAPTGRLRRLRAGVLRLAMVSAAASDGARFAFSKLRHPEWALLGVLTWWAFN
ncbi:MAG TPA: hypothetical protein VNV37_04815, partial [Solirubrobacteraceae bacterium]|nr:hypothetical protein [Solirubrobacteraceae bacterium]